MASGVLEREASVGVGAAARRSTRVLPRRLDRVLLAIVLLLALALRLPNLALVPQFTDETLEVLWSLPIARGEALPLVTVIAYIGALYNYLVAAAFVVFGPSAVAARGVVLAAGLLTVLATWGLARSWNGPLAGLLAAALMAVNAAHIAINSHVAWSNCTTPLFTTLAVWCLYVGTRGRGDAGTRRSDGEDAAMGKRGDADAEPSPRLRVPASPRPGVLVLSGFFWALALQTHLVVVSLLPGAALYLLWKGPRLLRTPWPYLALVAFLVGYANVIVHNVESGFESLKVAQRVQHNYTGDEEAATGYPAALGAALLLLARVLGGAVDHRTTPWGYLGDPVVLVGVGLAAAGVWRETRRGNPLPLLLSVSCLALLPAVNPKFGTLLTSRYLMPLVPILVAAMAGVLAGERASGRWGRLKSAPGGEGVPRTPSYRWVTDHGLKPAAWLEALSLSRSPALSLSKSGRPIALALALVLLLGPLPPLTRYYDRAFATGENNERAYRLAALVAEHRQPGELVVLDQAFGSERGGGVSELRGLQYLLAFEEVPVRVIKITPKRLEEELGSSPSLLVVLSGRLLGDMDRLPLEALTARPERGSEVGLFRLPAKG